MLVSCNYRLRGIYDNRLPLIKTFAFLWLRECGRLTFVYDGVCPSGKARTGKEKRDFLGRKRGFQLPLILVGLCRYFFLEEALHNMFLKQFSRALIACCTLAFFTPAVTHAQNVGANKTADSELATLYNEANVAFQKGDWNGAAAGFEKVIALVMLQDEKAQAQLGPVYYMLGASYFNQPDYQKAIGSFKKYLEKWPNADRVMEVKLGIAKASFFLRDFETVVKMYSQFENIPAYRDQALIAEGEAYKELNKPEDQIRVLEKLIDPEPKTTIQAKGAIMLVETYTNQGESEKAVKLLAKLQKKTSIIENLIALNELAVRLGDELAEKKLFADAIQAYRQVRSHDDVLKFQRDRLARMEKRIEENLKSVAGNPQAFVAATQINNEIKAAMAEQKELLTEFEKLPDFGPGLLMRIAKCWYDWDKKWEAIVVYSYLVQHYPNAKIEREGSLFAELVTYSELNQIPHCQELCDQYVKEYPDGPNAGTVGYLAGAVALQANDPQTAEKRFTEMLEKLPKSEYREKMRYLLGVSKFAQNKFPDAMKDFDQYQKDFPTGDDIEEVTYRDALTIVFQGDFDKAVGALDGYLQKYPSGTFVPDCKYRKMVCNYAIQKYDDVISAAKAWLPQYEKDKVAGEVAAILGDSLAAESKDAECIPAYIESFKKATTEEVVSYSLFEASKHMQKLGEWEEVSKMFEDFIKEHPEHPAVVASMYWIGKARARQGKTEEAKEFLVSTLKTYIGQPKKEAVEQLLQQLAQLCAKRPRPSPAALAAAAAAAPAVPVPTTPPAAGGPAEAPANAPVAPAATATVPAVAGAAATAATAPIAASATPGAAPEGAPVAGAVATVAATPEPPPYDPWEELDKQIKPLEENANATAKARLLYARSELDKLKKKTLEADDLYDQIANTFKPEDLSPVLLAQIGDFLAEHGKSDRASVMYTLLKIDYPKSDYLDYAYVGLGEIAFTAKKYDQALELFNEAVDKYAGAKIKEATIGKANTLMELAKYDEAKKLFEEVAGMREWRGESTAYAVYSLGEVEARQGHWAEAIAHYQRVYVAYQRYLPWVAKSYLHSAESFEKMGKRKEAISSLHEMLRNEKLENLPEAGQARKLLEKWGATV